MIPPGKSPLGVLNPWGGDADQPFPEGPGQPGHGPHPPINYHAYAACTGGGFYRDPSLVKEARVLLLLRRDLKAALKAMRLLQSAGKRVWVSLKESGGHQVAALLACPKRLALFREVCALAEGALSSTPDLLPLYRGAGCKEVHFIPTPYPLESADWDFSRPLEEREGIFIGTREFCTPSRNHLAALLAVRGLGHPVTVLNPDGRRGRRLLAATGYPEGQLRVVEGRLPYPEYLLLVSEHRLVFQMDQSAVPGQVAGDALLCRTPCVGGNGAVERLAFPDLCSAGCEAEHLVQTAALLLGDDAAWHAAVATSQRLAAERLGFEPVAAAL